MTSLNQESGRGRKRRSKTEEEAPKPLSDGEQLTQMLMDNLEAFGSPGKAIDACITDVRNNPHLAVHIITYDSAMERHMRGYLWSRLGRLEDKSDGKSSDLGQKKKSGRKKDKKAAAEGQERWDPSFLDVKWPSLDQIYNDFTFEQLDQLEDQVTKLIAHGQYLLDLIVVVKRHIVPTDRRNFIRDTIKREKWEDFIKMSARE